MMRGLKYLLFISIAVVMRSLPFGEGWGGVHAQQDAQYSQYMFNQLAINPAFAGSRERISSALVYRNQWTAVAGAPRTASFSFQMPVQKKKIGAGAEIVSDHIGPKSLNAILLSYAYRVPVGKGKLSFGLRMGLFNYAFDWAKMDYKDKSDLYNVGARDSKFTGTGDFGFYYYTRTFYWGAGVTHLNRGKIVAMGNDTASKQAIHFFMPVGKAFQAGNTVINPTILVKGTSGSTAEIDLNLNVLLKEKVWVGVSARSGYGFVFLTQYQINDHFKAGYSYDYGINKIGVAGKGSHEIMLGYDLNMRGGKMVMPRYL
ncbi:MAG: type IX secretion system membrane protein PorP/SprF [Bacteroidetes bacterium]|nr:MAG: type IX secretion system membrane protein PorP/SprF [Bacteroidota bacterium]